VDSDESVAKPKWGPLQAVIVTLGIYFGAQVVAVLIILALEHVGLKHFETNLSQFLFIFVVDLLTMGLLIKYLHHRHATLEDTGLNQPEFKHIAYALSGFAAYFVFYLAGLVIAKKLFPSLSLDQKQDLGFSTGVSGKSLIPIFISLVVLPPLVEETIMRGFLFTGLRSKLPFLTATLITSTLFAAAHLPEASSGLLWVGALDTFILSIILCYLREKTGSLWPSIGVHAIKNALAFVVLFNIVQYIR